MVAGVLEVGGVKLLASNRLWPAVHVVHAHDGTLHHAINPEALEAVGCEELLFVERTGVRRVPVIEVGKIKREQVVQEAGQLFTVDGLAKSIKVGPAPAGNSTRSTRRTAVRPL